MKSNFYLHLGEDTVVHSSEIIGIFDLDGTTLSKKTRDYLSKAERDGDVIYINYELPRSFAVCRDKNRKSGKVVYISQLSVQTLAKRAEGFNFN